MNLETSRFQVLYPLYRKSIQAALEYLDGKDNPLELWLMFTEDSPLNAIFTEGEPNKTNGIFALGPRTRKDHVVIEGDHLVVTNPATGIEHTVPFYNISCILIRGTHAIDGYHVGAGPNGTDDTYHTFYTVAQNVVEA